MPRRHLAWFSAWPPQSSRRLPNDTPRCAGGKLCARAQLLATTLALVAAVVAHATTSAVPVALHARSKTRHPGCVSNELHSAVQAHRRQLRTARGKCDSDAIDPDCPSLTLPMYLRRSRSSRRQDSLERRRDCHRHSRARGCGARRSAAAPAPAGARPLLGPPLRTPDPPALANEASPPASSLLFDPSAHATVTSVAVFGSGNFAASDSVLPSPKVLMRRA